MTTDPAPSYDRAALETAFAVLADKQAELTEAFYEHFFSTHPAAAPLFGERAASEREEMMSETLNSLLAWHDDEPWLASNLDAMGASHWEYGTTAEMYGAFIVSFLACARALAGEAWSDAAEDALGLALLGITEPMQAAGDRAAARASKRHAQPDHAGE